MQALRNRRKLKKGDIQLRVGNGAIISATDVGDVDLSLPTGLILHLSAVYFCPCITKNIISVSRMDSDNYEFHVKRGVMNFSLNGFHYGSGFKTDGLYLLDLNTPLLSIQIK